MISSTPRTSLLKVNPEPLPAVDPGDPQDITVEWSVRFGLRAQHDLCVTRNLSASPAGADHCVALPGGNVVNNGASGNTYEDALTLPSAFYTDRANFYIRTTSLIHLSGSPAIAYSNLVPFAWPLNLPNLYAHNPKPRIAGGMVQIEHDISNFGQADADPSETEFTVAFCDGLVQLPLIDPENPQSEQICRKGVEGFAGEHVVMQPVGPIAASAAVQTMTDITSLVPSSPNGLWISITARVDAGQDVDESNEQDNERLETRFIMP
jgi:hypothetical protein